ncbi:MAG TPA: Rrf2 family transcriptional regulator [Rhodopila sp.]|uniref:RrF2 family transcriptional regulator n=1 Tax=Rhodopila sp. TaxID=2480087 RepID=UPI002B6B835C|nr:Rrf2 family transcriptional regulator [Rhodopila sp.]HVY16291.1 Rrf2 family transcriptional regulator [Rhodopila sp.]
MLSSKAKYAVRAVAFLAERGRPDGWVQMAEIAEHERIPPKFLEAILVELRGRGIIESRRGAQGGHRLFRSPAEISVADLIRIVDGPLALTPCASRTQFHPCSDCVDIARCRLQSLMREARDAVAGVLEKCSVAELIARPGREALDRPQGGRPPGGRPRGRKASVATGRRVLAAAKEG